MRLIIMDSGLIKSRSINLGVAQIVGGLLALGLAMLLASGTLYHFVFVKGLREGWPVIGSLVRWVVQDEFAQRDRFVRENLDAMAQKLGEMQARLVQLEAIGERVSGLAGINPNDLKLGKAPGRGGVYVPGKAWTIDDLNTAFQSMEEVGQQSADMFTVIESRLTEQKMLALTVPTQRPVSNALVGSGFGFRFDPFNGRAALHTGLDFAAETGTPIQAAAGGVVVASELHPQYGNMIDVSHGNGLVTRYAHASQRLVKVGDLVKRGQVIGQVGSTGRSTGPHLHFEVLMGNVPQNPSKFLEAGRKPTLVAQAQALAQKLPAHALQRPQD